MRHRIYGLLLLFLLLAGSSCKKINEILTFNIKESTEITIENTIVPFSLPFELPTPNILVSSESEFENNKTSKNLVKDVHIEELALTIINPNNQKFSFLKSIVIYISADGVQKIELASKYDIPKDVNQIDLDVTESKLDDYLKADKYSLSTEVVIRETLTKDITVKADMTFEVTADPF